MSRGAPVTIFDQSVFEDLRDLRGDAALRVALHELSIFLRENFGDLRAHDLDRDRIFTQAHFLVARAGLMGFPALRDACVSLQHACATADTFGAQYVQACDAATDAQVEIASLLKRL